MLRHARDQRSQELLDAVDAAATFHDLGKLDPDTQEVLRRGRGGKLYWDHIDAGVAHLSSNKDWMAAWLVRAHHAPGLPEKQEHFNPDNLGRRLRGRRRDDEDRERHAEQRKRTDEHLTEYVRLHHSVSEPCGTVGPRRPSHGLSMRLALSCLVDADHSDTAFFDTGQLPPKPPEPRWAERLDALRQFVSSLPTGSTEAERSRNRRRAAFFYACLNARIEEPLVACEGPVGLGKTTAVAAYLIRCAIGANPELRRLIVVAPYTNILTQTAERLRKALVLPGERPQEVVAEHHHRADFEHQNDRDLAVLWRAPVVLTTAVTFFESLAANNPASLRKLHALPGSAVFLDEAHAALPAKLWRQNWKWVRELAERWGCRFVFASGTLARFWEDQEIVVETKKLPELLPPNQAEDVLAAERSRVRYDPLHHGLVLTVRELIEEVDHAPGPRLVILNTVQNAAVVANAMRDAGLDVLHLSTALTPRDRDRILRRVIQRLKKSERADWTLVATSCVEAGVDFSFRCGFRERFAVSSTIQIGGRVNRHGEYDPVGGGIVYDFALSDDDITQHPAAKVSAQVLRELMANGEMNRGNPGDIVTNAMRAELAIRGDLDTDMLSKAETARNYPAVSEHGRVIDAETRIVVVDERLKILLAERRPISFRLLLRGSVQLWATKIEKLGLSQFPGRHDLYVWNDAYEPEFLGYMVGVLRNERFLRDGGAII
ncbi:MAG TPA: DEAD/DEAH box helicase [Thermoanaerobaculia bacterium]|nr:DEAD/DEAH box helicase [Thermoanaerobaculia bacterium]